MHIIVINGKAYKSEEVNGEQALTEIEDGAYEVKSKRQDIRTAQQNRALHKYFSLVAEALSDAGLDVKKTLRSDVPWSPDSVKDMMWRPLQEALLGKKSTTALKKNEIDQVYDVMNRVLSTRYGVHVPFPSLDNLLFDERLKNLDQDQE